MSRGFGERFYRLLLLCFPRDVRRKYGEEMNGLFAQQFTRASFGGRLRLLTRAVVDAARHGMGERLERRAIARAHAQRHSETGRWWMDTFQHDVRYAWRLLLRQPAATAAIVLTLALGIGANTAVFSVVHAVLLRPLPYRDPGALVMIWERRAAEGVDDNFVSPADYLDWARLNRSFESITAFSASTADLTGSGDPVQLPIAGVSASFFDVLGVRAALGRTFAPGEDVLGSHRVVVLTDGLWRQRFGSDPAVVGRTILLNDVPQQVIGVLPASFDFTDARPKAFAGDVDTAVLFAPLVLQGGTAPPPRASHQLTVYARLKNDVSVDAARRDMERIGQGLSAAFRENIGHTPNVVPLRDELVAPARAGLLLLMSSVTFLLLIACTNVANLLLARSAGRRRELAIRSAVGAGRMRLLRQSLTESLLVSVIGGVVGLLVASWTVQALVAQTPVALRTVGLERARLDTPVLLFTGLVCVITAILAGALPAWQISRTAPGDPLRETGRSPLSLRRSVRVMLIASEVALTVLLLIGAGLMVRSFVRAVSQPAGMDTSQRLVVNLRLPRARYAQADTVRQVRRELDERFRTIPGVISAGANNNLPLTASDARQGVTVEGYERREGEAPVRAHTRIVTPGYFDAMGISMREGRPFLETDDARAGLVAVVNETMAQRYWPGQSPLGKRLRFNGEKEPWWTVVGVIADVRHWGLDRDVNPELYVPHDQLPSGNLSYVLHSSADPLSLVPAVAARVKAVDPKLPMCGVRTYEAVAARSMASRRWSAMLLGFLAVLGLCLAAAGIYGVMTHLVSLQTSEIGIRLTLGANPAAVLWQVIGEAMFNTAVGLIVGLAAGVALSRALESMLYQVAPLDPATFAAAAAVVCLVAALAALGPAFRAMRLDPMQTLRQT